MMLIGMVPDHILGISEDVQTFRPSASEQREGIKGDPFELILSEAGWTQL
jgi:hypothetical protein